MNEIKNPNPYIQLRILQNGIGVFNSSDYEIIKNIKVNGSELAFVNIFIGSKLSVMGKEYTVKDINFILPLNSEYPKTGIQLDTVYGREIDFYCQINVDVI